MLSATEKAKNIRLLILDVDGILTCGKIFASKDDDEKSFHLHDGMGIKLLQRAGIQVALLSGKKSQAVANRAAELGIEHAYLGFEDKVPTYELLKRTLQLSDEAIAYMGDDLPDLPLLMRAGLAISVPNAPSYIQKQADMITVKHGGEGAVREVCEFILHAQDKFDAILAHYANR